MNQIAEIELGEEKIKTMIKEGEQEVSDQLIQNGNDSLLSEKANLSWWNERQKEAWSSYQSLPLPKRKDIDWRFASIKSIQLDSFHYLSSISKEDQQSIIEQSSFAFKTEGEASIFANDQLIRSSHLSKELEEKGVIWESLSEALEKHPEKIKKYLMTQETELGAKKFAALHAAYCRAGSVFIIPKNVQVELPFLTYHWLVNDNASVFPHTLIIAEENSSVTVVDVFKSLRNEKGFSCSVNDIIVAPGAKVNYLCCQDWSESTLSMQLGSTVVEKDAYAKTLNFNLGGAFSRIESHSKLVGSGARSEMLSVSVCHDNQEFDQRTLQNHMAPHTWSDLLYKNTLNHRAKSIFQGLIKVAEGARQTDAYQTNRNLLLNPNAEADSMPGLEILNDDVKCSHGATTGQIDEDELFYFLARGIKPHMAQHLISIGFFEEVLERFDQKEINAELRKLIEKKFAQSANIKMSSSLEKEEIDETNVRKLQGSI